MVYGYIRVSTDDQDMDNQKHSILEYSNTHKIGHIEFVQESISSRVAFEKRDLSLLLDELKEGDIILTTEISRIGRSLMEIMTIFQKLIQKGVTTHIIKSGFKIGGDENKIQSNVLIFAFGLAADIERDLISQRTKAALAKRKAQGMKLGRKKGAIIKSKLDGKEREIIALLDKKIPVASIARIFGVARTTMVNFIATRKLDLSKNPSV